MGLREFLLMVSPIAIVFGLVVAFAAPYFEKKIDESFSTDAERIAALQPIIDKQAILMAAHKSGYQLLEMLQSTSDSVRRIEINQRRLHILDQEETKSKTRYWSKQDQIDLDNEYRQLQDLLDEKNDFSNIYKNNVDADR